MCVVFYRNSLKHTKYTEKKTVQKNTQKIQTCSQTQKWFVAQMKEPRTPKTEKKSQWLDLVHAAAGNYEFSRTRGLCFLLVEQMLTWQGLPSWEQPLTDTLSKRHWPIVSVHPVIWVFSWGLPPPHPVNRLTLPPYHQPWPWWNGNVIFFCSLIDMTSCQLWFFPLKQTLCIHEWLYR